VHNNHTEAGDSAHLFYRYIKYHFYATTINLKACTEASQKDEGLSTACTNASTTQQLFTKATAWHIILGL